MRLRFRLEFDGEGLCGWQLQEGHEGNQPTVQEHVERALQTVLRLPARAPVQGCGRTDAGVHAEEFFAHVDLEQPPADLERVRHSLNGLLPENIAVTHLDEAPAGWHALKSVEKKCYRYSVLLRRCKPTLQRRRVWWLPIDPASSQHFDSARLAGALKILEGQHDFAAFAAAGGETQSSVRTLFRCEVFQEPVALGLLLHLEFEGDGFLKQMVRNMAGTVMEVAQGRRELAQLKSLLRPGAQRVEAGVCAPAQGLTLRSVRYGAAP